MPRIHRLAGALALALAASGAAQAQQFSNVITFGDSLSDAGQYSNPLVFGPNAAAAGSFTTNPDPVAAQLIAGYYLGINPNASVASSLGGSNYAYGGAPIAFVPVSVATSTCIPATLPCLSLTQQLTQHLASRGGRADPNALYQVWGGANDIFFNFGGFGQGLFGNPTTAAAQGALTSASTAAATREIGLISTLQTAGASYIVVYNLPDIGASPEFRTTGSTAQLVTSVIIAYNNTLNAGLNGREGIIPINTFGLVNEVIANPTAFGLTNVTTRACNTALLPGGSSLFCTPAALVAPGANNTHLFADGVHPTGAGHRLLADAVIATIAAPSVISMAPEVALQAHADHNRALDESLMTLWGDELETGSVRGYASVQGGNQDIEADGYSPGLDGNSYSLSLGANYRLNENFTFGAIFSVGNQSADTGDIGYIDGVSVLGSAYVQYQNGGLYLRGNIGGGSSTLDITRNVVIGPMLRQHEGSTAVSHQAAGAEIGYMFRADSVQHGPFASVQRQKLTVESFREDDTTSTAMNYSEFDRDSQLASLGYQIQGSFGSEGSMWRPFVRVAWVDESETDSTHVSAGSNSMNGRFTMAGYTPSEDWYTASLGLSGEFGDGLSGYLTVDGRFGDDHQDSGNLTFGVRKTF